MHWQILAWPLRPTPLITLGAFVLVGVAFTAWAALDFWVGVMVLSLGLPIWYAVFGGLSLAAEKLFSQTTAGLFDEAIDSETDVNPFQRSLAFKLCFAHLVAFVILFGSGPEPGPLLLIPAALFPLMWISILMDESVFGGFAPKRAGRLLGGLSVLYPLVMLLISGSIGWLHYALIHAPGFLNILASGFAFLYGNLLCGCLLYARRGALNLHTRKSPEQALAAELDAETRELDKLFHDLHTHVNAGSFGTAIAKLDAYVSRDPEVLDPFIRERLLEFRDNRLTLEHAVRYLQRLVDRDEPRKAWAIMKECLAMDARFRPPSDATLLRLTRAAGRDDVALVNDLLADFDRAYPDSALIPEARFRRARICIELLRDGETGVALLASIRREFPEFAATEAFRRYQQRLKFA